MGKPEASSFKDYERIEEAKYRPPAPLPPIDSGELPDSYGQPKVTLMVVNPYLVHAYWDVDFTRLPADAISAVLRFYDVSEASLVGAFDVDVDLRVWNWYVHLWSPARSYYADLGIKTADSGFIFLARSNRIQIPRGWPVAEVDRPARPIAPASKSVERATLEVPSGRDEIAPVVDSATTIEPQSDVLKPAHAAEVLQKRLSEIYSLRQWRPRPSEAAVTSQHDAPLQRPDQRAPSQGTVEPFTPRRTSPPLSVQPSIPFDLTSLGEHQFSPGLSSALSPSQDQKGQ